MKSNAGIQLVVMAASLLTGCSASAPESTSATPVGDAYQAIVRAVADCGKQAADCARAAGDDQAAHAECAVKAEACAAAGGDAAEELGEAARACEEQMEACVAETGDGAACSAQLRACLGVGGDDTDEDAAGGPPAGRGPRGDDTDEDAAGGPPAGRGPRGEDTESAEDKGAGGPPAGTPGAVRRDCRAKLEPCLAAGSDASVCAEEVRACVAAILPEPTDMISGGEDTEEPGEGRGRGGRPTVGELPERAASARACVDALHTCANGADPAPDACVAEMEACMAARGEEEVEEVPTEP
jgi:hypothetical protein